MVFHRHVDRLLSQVGVDVVVVAGVLVLLLDQVDLTRHRLVVVRLRLVGIVLRCLDGFVVRLESVHRSLGNRGVLRRREPGCRRHGEGGDHAGHLAELADDVVTPVGQRRHLGPRLLEHRACTFAEPVCLYGGLVDHLLRLGARLRQDVLRLPLSASNLGSDLLAQHPGAGLGLPDTSTGLLLGVSVDLLGSLPCRGRFLVGLGAEPLRIGLGLGHHAEGLDLELVAAAAGLVSALLDPFLRCVQDLLQPTPGAGELAGTVAVTGGDDVLSLLIGGGQQRIDGPLRPLGLLGGGRQLPLDLAAGLAEQPLVLGGRKRPLTFLLLAQPRHVCLGLGTQLPGRRFGLGSTCSA